MYYYIFDIKRCRKKSQVEAIKSYLTNLGISGEYAYITPNQTAEALAESGINKGYNTIIAVGSDDLVNAVTNVLVGRKEVLGVLPLMASDELKELIGSDDWQPAAEALRFRKIRELNTGKIANGRHFLTSLYLDTVNPLEVTLEFKDFLMQVTTKNVLISNFHPDIEKRFADHLDVVIESEAIIKSGLLAKLGFRTIKNETGEHISFIRAKSLRIFTKKPMPLVSGDKIIAKTPQFIESTDELTRIIVAKNL